jgi:type IV pilus assembly protein PilN
VIKINLVREGRAAVRGATAAPGGVATGAGPANINGLLIVGLLVVGILAAGGYWFLRWNELKRKEAEVAVKRAEAEKLESIIREVEEFQKRKESLEQRIALINDLKRNQKNPVKILDRISQDLPDLVWLDRMKLDGMMIELEGRALNPNAVANFVINLKGDPLFNEPSLASVSQASAGGSGRLSVYSYKMTVSMKAPPPVPATPEEGGEAGKPGGEGTQDAGAAQGA